MAEGLLKAAVKGGCNVEDVSVSSAGVSAMSGQAMSAETREILEAKGATVSGFRSQQVDDRLLKAADLVIAMTSSHAQMVRMYFSEASDKLSLLTDFIDPEEGLSGADIPDPIGMGRAAYEEVAEVMALAMPGIISVLAKE